MSTQRVLAFGLLAIFAAAAPREAFSQIARDRATAQQSIGAESPYGTRLNPNSPGYFPQPDYFTPRWRLGVDVDNSRTGAVVTEVFPNSAAERHGIERGDVLVAINGYQVGYVGNELFDISDEFALRADRFGRVTLLVQNNRDGRLVNMVVGLDTRGTGGYVPISPRPTIPVREASISGRVTFRERIVLPASARLRVELVQRPTQTSKNVTVVAEFNQRTLGKQQPLLYEIAYRPEALDPARFYTIRCFLDVDRNLRIQTPEEIPIQIEDPPARLDLFIARP